jgi:hypothetical protein
MFRRRLYSSFWALRSDFICCVRQFRLLAVARPDWYETNSTVVGLKVLLQGGRETRTGENVAVIQEGMCEYSCYIVWFASGFCQHLIHGCYSRRMIDQGAGGSKAHPNSLRASMKSLWNGNSVVNSVMTIMWFSDHRDSCSHLTTPLVRASIRNHFQDISTVS